MRIIKDKKEVELLYQKGVATQSPKHSELYEELAKIEVGQAVLIKKEEWKNKSHPSVGISSYTYFNKRKGYGRSPMAKKFIGKKFSVFLLDTDEYLIRRIK